MEKDQPLEKPLEVQVNGILDENVRREQLEDLMNDLVRGLEKQYKRKKFKYKYEEDRVDTGKTDHSGYAIYKTVNRWHRLYAKNRGLFKIKKPIASIDENQFLKGVIDLHSHVEEYESSIVGYISDTAKQNFAVSVNVTRTYWKDDPVDFKFP